MNGTLLELYRHKTWATLRLMEHRQGLDDEHLDATIPGTFGTIRDTLRHLVDGEEGYFRDVTGEHLSEPLPSWPVPLDELAERIRHLGRAGRSWPRTPTPRAARSSPRTAGECR
jgi:uncharacterized damage-inducible protein DinB